MKKALKILGISLGSIMLLVVAAILAVCYVIVTPKRLTPIVNQVADSIITCPHEIEEVNLTFFRTFPHFGVEIKGLYIINPMDGAETDTVLAVPSFVASLDIKKAIKGDIYIYQFALNDAQANIYTDSAGNNNYDVIQLPEDTTEDNDTTSSWHLNSIGFEGTLSMNAKKLTFVNQKDSIYASAHNTVISISEHEYAYGIKLEATLQETDVTIGETDIAKNMRIGLTLPIEIADSQKIQIDGTQIAINEFNINLDGYIQPANPSWVAESYSCDLRLNTNDWHISSLLALVPKQYTAIIPKEIKADGDIQIAAHTYGIYDSVSMPLADIQVLLKNGYGNYDLTILPYKFTGIDADVEAHIDMNTKPNTTLTINKIHAETGNSGITAEGKITDILKEARDIEIANPLCQIKTGVDINLPDANYWLQSDSTESWLKGRAKGDITLKARLDDITSANINKLNINGDINISNLQALYQDSIQAEANNLNMRFNAPRKNVKGKNTLSADMLLKMDKAYTNIMSAGMTANISDGQIKAMVETGTKDTTHIPTISADFSIGNLSANMDTIAAKGNNIAGKISLRSSRRDKTVPSLQANFASDNLYINMGQSISANTKHINIEVATTYRNEAENILLKWNPRLKFDLVEGHTDIAAIGTPIDIPQIKFNYSNRDFQIETSRIVIGKSDFSLSGNISNLGKWLRKEGDLTGSLSFISEHTDINELIALSNHLTANNDSTQANTGGAGNSDTEAKQSSEPFMVPEHVDLSLLTIIKSAGIFNQHLHNLGGQVYIQDGKLILEEMGFICEAAKLQLTAMYKTPRKSHIYVGLDYHMIDIDLQQLISMIPQIDTLVPMLRDFKGGAQFHIAAETYVNDKYDIKYSTLRGACSIEGKDLVLLDNATFSTISKILLFNKKTENKIDSISAQIALYKDQVTVYPFCISIDNYMAAVGGNHYLDMNFNYHASLLKPFYLGVDVTGNLDDLKIRPAKCRYAQDFRPLIHKDAESQSAELRKIISSSLKKNVKIQ